MGNILLRHAVMHLRIKLMKLIAWIYAFVIGILALWAWYIDIKLLHSPIEHLLPDIMLAVASQPLSLTLGPLYSHWPSLFEKPLVQLSWITLCGVIQVTILFMLTWFMSKRKKHA